MARAASARPRDLARFLRDGPRRPLPLLRPQLLTLLSPALFFWFLVISTPVDGAAVVSLGSAVDLPLLSPPPSAHCCSSAQSAPTWAAQSRMIPLSCGRVNVV